MQLNTIEAITIQILKDAGESFLFPYQIFNRIKKQNPALGKQIETAYPPKTGKPTMGEGAGIPYSCASFVGQALSKFKETHPEIQQEKIDGNDLKIEGIVPGNKKPTSIWAWKETV